jgi:hypothetical protein
LPRAGITSGPSRKPAAADGIELPECRTALNEATLDLEVRKFRLRSFLGFNETVDIELFIDPEVPVFRPDLGKALQEALNNNPEVFQYERQLLEADREVARARAERVSMPIFLPPTVCRPATLSLHYAYRDPMVAQRLQIGQNSTGGLGTWTGQVQDGPVKPGGGAHPG